MNTEDLDAIQLPCGPDGKHKVTILVSEIASYESHTVVSYSYEEWNRVTLKNGVQHDCKVSHDTLTKMIREAVGG